MLNHRHNPARLRSSTRQLSSQTTRPDVCVPFLCLAETAAAQPASRQTRTRSVNRLHKATRARLRQRLRVTGARVWPSHIRHRGSTFWRPAPASYSARSTVYERSGGLAIAGAVKVTSIHASWSVWWSVVAVNNRASGETLFARSCCCCCCCCCCCLRSCVRSPWLRRPAETAAHRILRYVSRFEPCSKPRK